MDIKSKESRSLNMSKIRASGTKPELFIRSELHRLGYRFRVNYNPVCGHPDLYFTKKNVAIFVHGCFWHRHENCNYAYFPKSNVDFWMKKFENNLNRDIYIISTLHKCNVRTLIIWECSIKKMKANKDTKHKYISLITNFLDYNKSKHLEI